MSKKLITVGLAAALAFSLSPVATAQSSAPALSSSSGTNSVSKVQQVEDKFAKVFKSQGHTRHTQHDQAAEKAVQDAVNGNVLFATEPHSNVPGFAGGQNFSDGYLNVYLRFPLEHIDTVLRNMDDNSATDVLPGYAVPFGVAVDESQSLVYVAFVVPLSAMF